MKLYVKNMVCDRCKLVVKERMNHLGLHPLTIELGVIELLEKTLTSEQETAVKLQLQTVGFELLEDRKSQIVEAIKTAVIDMVYNANDEVRLKLSEHVTRRLDCDYRYLSGLFSEAVDMTIEQFAIQQKIERVKELLSYGELTLSEISYELGYSSVAALSGQFKKVVKVTPSVWKTSNSARNPLDKVGSTAV